MRIKVRVQIFWTRFFSPNMPTYTFSLANTLFITDLGVRFEKGICRILRWRNGRFRRLFSLFTEQGEPGFVGFSLETLPLFAYSFSLFTGAYSSPPCFDKVARCLNE